MARGPVKTDLRAEQRRGRNANEKMKTKDSLREKKRTEEKNRRRRRWWRRREVHNGHRRG